MSSPTSPKPQWLRMILAAVGALASTALVGALIASLLSLDGRNPKPPLKNPFDASRPLQ